MCHTRDDEKSEKEDFVDSAIRKKLRNKRKRDPDMRVEAVLECTVRRLYAEILGLHSCNCPSPKRRKTSQDCKDTNRTNCQDEQMDCKKSVRDFLEEKVTSNFEDSAPPTPVPHTNTALTNASKMKSTEERSNTIDKNSEKDEEIDFESLLQSISELTDSTMVSSEDMDIDINELLQELACEPTLNSCKDEDLFNNNDPFLPGMFEILCS